MRQGLDGSIYSVFQVAEHLWILIMKKKKLLSDAKTSVSPTLYGSMKPVRPHHLGVINPNGSWRPKDYQYSWRTVYHHYLNVYFKTWTLYSKSERMEVLKIRTSSRIHCFVT